MKSYPRNWQHIYLLSRALMLIWEKLYSEANGKKRSRKKTFHGWVWLDRRQENVTHIVNKYISAHNRRMILQCSTNRLQFKCLVWCTRVWRGMRGWCKHEKVSTCVCICASLDFMSLSCSLSLSGRKRGVSDKVLIKSYTERVVKKPPSFTTLQLTASHVQLLKFTYVSMVSWFLVFGNLFSFVSLL